MAFYAEGESEGEDDCLSLEEDEEEISGDEDIHVLKYNPDDLDPGEEEEEEEDAEQSSDIAEMIGLKKKKKPTIITMEMMDPEFMQYIQNIKDEVMLVTREQDQVRNAIKEQITLASNQRTDDMKNMKADILKELDERQHYVDEIQTDIENFINRQKREKSDYTIEVSTIQEKVGYTMDQIDKSMEVMENIANIIIQLVEAQQIQSALDHQDENDRTGISLMGFKDDPIGTTRTRNTNKRTESNI